MDACWLQCTALSHCDLPVLKAHDLVAAMRGFPDSAAKVRKRAMGRFAQLQAAGDLAAVHHRLAPNHLKKLNPSAAEAEDAEAWADQVAAGTG